MSTMDKVPNPVCTLLAEAFKRQQTRQYRCQNLPAPVENAPTESLTVSASPEEKEKDQNQKQETQDGRH